MRLQASGEEINRDFLQVPAFKNGPQYITPGDQLVEVDRDVRVRALVRHAVRPETPERIANHRPCGLGEMIPHVRR